MQFVDPAPQAAAQPVAAQPVPFAAGDPAEVPPLPEDASFFQRIVHYTQRFRAYKDDRLKSLRPWSEFFDRSEFSAPSKMEALARISRNYTYFYSNYFVVTMLLSSYILFTNISFLLAMVLCSAFYYWCRLKVAANEPLVILGRELSPVQAYAGLVVSSVLLFYMTNGSSTIFWLVTAALIVVAGHASFRRPVEEQSAAAGMFQFV